MLLIHTGNEQVPYFFLRKDVVKVCISSLIAFNGEKHKFCIWGTVPDRVFISTSYCDVPDTLISIFAQWIDLKAESGAGVLHSPGSPLLSNQPISHLHFHYLPSPCRPLSVPNLSQVSRISD